MRKLWLVVSPCLFFCSLTFAQPRIFVEPLELGPVVEDFSEHVVNIANDGDEPLAFQIELDLDGGPAGWIATDPEEAVVDPVSDLDLVVETNLLDMLGGQYQAEIHILNNDPDRGDVVVTLTADVASIPLIGAVGRIHRLAEPDQLERRV